MTIKIYHLVFGLAALAAAAALWFLLAPPLLGGSTSYAIVRGTSMAPQFRNGDLAVIRGASEYSVGEIAAYRNRDFDRVVLHRIVRRDGDRYRFKGDNNSYVDSAEATKSDIVGRLWFAVPGPGAMLAWARVPVHALLLALVAPLLAALRWSAASWRGSRRSRTGGGDRDGNRAAAARRSRGALALCALAGLGGLAFLFLPMLPTSRSGASPSYEQRGRFSYGAVPAAAGVYPTGRVTTGDPVFLRLVRDLRLAFAYRFSSAFPHSLEGSAGLRLVLQNPEGWRHEIVLQAPHRFRGDTAVSAGTLHLDRLLALLARFQAATGVTDQTYTLTVSPLVSVHGTAAGAPLADRFTPQLQFQLDALELRVVPPQTLGSGPPSDPFLATRTEILSGAAAPARSLLLGPSVSRLRTLALVACALALLGALALGLPALRSRLQRGADDPEKLYGGRLVRVASTRLAVSRATVVEVPDPRGLLHLADGLERPILHDSGGAYLVEGDAFVYRYAPGEPDTSRAPVAQRAAPPARPTTAPIGDALT